MKEYLNSGGTYGSCIMQELHLPETLATPEAVAAYEALGKRHIQWMTSEDIPGCNILLTSWYFEPNREQQLQGRDISEFECHVHETEEVLFYYGSDWDHPWDLHGEIEFIIGGEAFIITRSSLIRIPAGVPHSKPLVNKVDRPILHLAMEFSK